MLTTTDAKLLARLEFKTHGLRDFKLSFSGLTKDGRVGECWSERKKIILCKRTLKSDLLFLTVLKHEIAHALQFLELGGYDDSEESQYHGPVFQKWAKKLGVPACPFVDSIVFH